MSTISRKDFILILVAAFQMASKDSNLDPHEKEVITNMVKVGHVTREELQYIRQHAKKDVKLYLNELSNELAEKTFLLTIATIAMADSEIDREEQIMVDELSDRLDLKRIELNTDYYQKYEMKVLQILKDHLEG